MTHKRKGPLHPGWACCDLGQDLAGWIARQREAFAKQRLVAREWRIRGEQAKRDSIAATIADDSVRAGELQAECIYACGMANAIMQGVLIQEGHVDRVEEAHRWRLDSAPESS